MDLSWQDKWDVNGGCRGMLAYLSITHISGDTRAEALAADNASAPMRRPRCSVFHPMGECVAGCVVEVCDLGLECGLGGTGRGRGRNGEKKRVEFSCLLGAGQWPLEGDQKSRSSAYRSRIERCCYFLPKVFAWRTSIWC